MKFMRLFTVLMIVLSLSACKKEESDEKSSKDSSDTVIMAAKVDLFNSIEKLTQGLSKKKYIELYDSLEEIFELSNKANIVSEKTDAAANKYIKNLNQLSEDINNEANYQKAKEISFSYEKSQLEIISSIASGGKKEEESSGGSSESGGGSESSGGGGNSSGGEESSGSSGGEESSKEGGKEEEEEEKIVIPEEETLKKYPEIIITDKDNQIMDLAVDLLGYVSQVSLEADKENPTALSNREKYLLYKITSLVKLDEYADAGDLVSEAQNNWDKLYIKVQDQNKQDSVTLSALIKNIRTSVEKKDPVAVDLQSKVAIKLLDNLSIKNK